MDNRAMIQKSLDYIEANLQTDITAQELAQLTHLSLFHYYRLFRQATGLPVMQYILRRRLLHGIYYHPCKPVRLRGMVCRTGQVRRALRNQQTHDCMADRAVRGAEGHLNLEPGVIPARFFSEISIASVW